MCGITGFFNIEGQEKKAKEALETISYRGKDAKGFDTEVKGSMGHCLLALQKNVPQPLVNEKFSFVANCEVYNWDLLDKKNNVNSKNDADALFNHVSASNDMENLLKDVDGVYAFALWNKKINKVFLARDLIGVKPLWLFFDAVSGGFAFASEKKALKSQGLEEAFIFEANPRKIFMYDLAEKSLKEYDREFFEVKTSSQTEEKVLEKTEKLLIKAIEKRAQKDRKLGVLFSGGIDSTFIALILKKLKIPFTCYASGLKQEGLKDSEDLEWAKRIAEDLDLDLKIKEINLQEVPAYLKKVLPLIEDNNVVKAGVATTFYLAAEMAAKDDVKILFSGLGSEEIFAGYNRHSKGTELNEECLSGLRRLYERDLYRDDVIAMSHTIEIRIPFLDKELVKYSLTIPEKYKLNKEQNKIVLRKIAKKLGLKEEYADRKKVAAQYGSNFNKAIQKLANKERKSKSEYLKQFYDAGNVKLGALLSTGKDSCLATHVMMEQNYEIKCFITITSENQDSYMYHGPNTHLAKLQSEASGIPLIVQETKGEKEAELIDLKKAIRKAIDKYRIEGIVTGALFSNYQRKRIEKICDELGIKCFSPIWHMDQEKELELLMNKDIKFCMVKIAADGLTKDWLGKIITHKEIKKLMELNKKNGFNVAGEGGEYESLVLKAPFMSKELVIEKFSVKEENEHTATMIVEKASLK